MDLFISVDEPVIQSVDHQRKRIGSLAAPDIRPLPLMCSFATSVKFHHSLTTIQ